MPDLKISDMPLVSVITVTYNSSPYVRSAIESVLAQSYSNIEYIIGDDCSNDNTWQIICSYNDSRIKAYRNNINLGEYPNRNMAIDMANGKYLIFIDGDDVIYDHGVSYFVSMAEAYPDVSMLIQKGYTNNVIFPVVLKPNETISNYFFGKKNLLTSSFASNFFNTNLLKSNGRLSINYKTGDNDIRLRLASKYPVLFVQGWVSWPRETPGQASSKLNNGVGFFEYFMMSKELIENTTSLDKTLCIAISNELKKRLSRYIIMSFLKARISIVQIALEKTNFGPWDVIKNFIHQSPPCDFLSKYNSANPLTINSQ